MDGRLQKNEIYNFQTTQGYPISRPLKVFFWLIRREDTITTHQTYRFQISDFGTKTGFFSLVFEFICDQFLSVFFYEKPTFYNIL